MVEDFDDFDDDFEDDWAETYEYEYDDSDDFEDFDDEYEDFDDFEEEFDFDNLDPESKEEFDIFDERPLEGERDYDINAVEVHISTQLTSRKIIELLDNYPSLKRITCPMSIYNRVSPIYIKALEEQGVSIEVKYNWGKKKYSKTQINQVIDLFNEGKRSKKIASYYDRINVKHYKRKYDDDCRLKVKSLKESGLKPKEISKELDIPIRSVYYILNKK